MPTVLFLDDDVSFLRINRVYFESRGYTVLTADRFEQAEELLRGQTVDCIVLDVLMPSIDGWEACRRLKGTQDIPILFLTSLSEQECLYRGFELGADDYMTKPYEFRELELRVRARLRRRSGGAAQTLSYPPLTIDVSGRKAEIGGKALSLTAYEFDILCLLAAHPGQVFSLEDIYRQVWKQPDLGRTESARIRVAQMRHKLEDACPDRVLIDRVWGKGFVFRWEQTKEEAPVRTSS